MSKALSYSLPYLRELSMLACSIAGPIDRSLLKLKSFSVIHLDSTIFSPHFQDSYIQNFNTRIAEFPFLLLQWNMFFPKRLPTLHALHVSQNELLEGSLPDFLYNNSIHSIVISDSLSFQGDCQFVLFGNLGKLSRLELCQLQI